VAQQRINIFGSLIDTADLPTMVASLFSPGRFTGCDFQVGGVDLLRITPGSALLPDGVLIIEDEPKTLVIGNSSFAADYTILYQLEDSSTLGGSPAILRATSGITKQSSFTDSVVLGWVRYPGGAVPLSSAHFVQPFPLRVSPKTATYYTSFLPTFKDAVRPANEIGGYPSSQNLEFSNLTSTQTRTLAFGGQGVRITGASVLSPVDLKPIEISSTLIPDPDNYIRVQLKKGPVVLFQYDTRAAPTGQGYIRAGVPALFEKQTGLDPNSFILGSNEALTLVTTRVGNVPDTFGSIAVSYESPGTSGRWSETSEILANESVVRWQNISNMPETYLLSFPFVVASDGQPRKLIARLQVDFNCIFTISIKAGGKKITLSPSSGIVSNTGTLITREFDIPVDPSIDWVPASVATVDVEINAQPGRGAALGQLSLALEPSPFLLFTS